MAVIKFDILINNAFAEICGNKDIAPTNNKWVLSLLNDFEGGKWRYEKFSDYIWNNIAETALSKAERDNMIDAPMSKIKASAKNLRLVANDERGRGSEIAEILLYGIMKDYYNALSVVPKIFHKQNVNDNAKGADSVHIVLTPDNKDFSLWFGEAKFYKSLAGDDLDNIVESVGNSLDFNKIKKENSIITDLHDLDTYEIPDDIRNAIYDLLNQQTSIDYILPKIHIPILLLHECGRTKSATEMSDTYKEILSRKHIKKANEYFEKQIDKLGGSFKYSEINFHLILFPVPDKDAIVDEFVKTAETLR